MVIGEIEMIKKSSKIPPAQRAAAKEQIPLYQREFYSWLYESPRLTRWFDHQYLLNILTFGTSSKMVKSCVDEIPIASDVLQMGSTFGDQIGKSAAKVGLYGHYDLLDVSVVQLRHQRNKYCYLYPFMRFINGDASRPIKKRYDIVICYMLLHEVPSATREQIINNALDCLKPKGKAIFIDYNNSVIWHPLRWLVKIFNRLYQPFAEKLWHNEIRNYARNPSGYYWRKTTFLGRMYQKVIVTKKEGLY